MSRSTLPEGAVPFKDHFSTLASVYSEFRPTYPDTLLDFVAGLCTRRDLAWDCACGSGQATMALAERFARVIATDASAKQLAAAPQHARVTYRVSPAENSGIESESVDLVVVAQAVHWFDLERFYADVARVLRHAGVLALWSYGALQLETDAVNRIVQEFYHDTVGPYWPPERRIVEAGYDQLPFPYPDIPAPPISLEQRWTLPRLLGYLRSWSATGRYIERHGSDPVAALQAPLGRIWGEPDRERLIVWPLTLRVGRKP